MILTLTRPSGAALTFGCGVQGEKQERAELEARLAVLGECERTYLDAGPVYDCVVVFDGQRWRAAVDTSESGDLSQARLMADYKFVHAQGVN